MSGPYQFFSIKWLWVVRIDGFRQNPPGTWRRSIHMARHDQTWLHRGLLLEKRKYAKETQLPTIKSKGLESRPNPLVSPTVNTVIQFCKLIPLTL